MATVRRSPGVCGQHELLSLACEPCVSALLFLTRTCPHPSGTPGFVVFDDFYRIMKKSSAEDDDDDDE